MIRDIQEGAIYAVFALAALYATLPVWRIPLIGLNPQARPDPCCRVFVLAAVHMHFAMFARGSLVDEATVADALESGHLGGGSNGDVIAGLERGEADLAAMEWWDGREGLVARIWAREPQVVIVAPDHRWAELGSLSVAELQGEPLLGGESGTGTGHLLRSQLGPSANALTIVDGFKGVPRRMVPPVAQHMLLPGGGKTPVGLAGNRYCWSSLPFH